MNLFEIAAPNFNLKDQERKHIMNTIRYTNGNIAQAAKLLGISKPNLYFRFKKLKIDLNEVNKIRISTETDGRLLNRFEK